MREDELLPAVVVEPEGDATGSVIWLHGLGADGNDFAPVLPLLPLARLGVRVILPHAPSMPVTINGGFRMPAWYDIRPEDHAEGRHDEAGIRASALAVEAWLQAEASRGVAPERTALIGFSQGGAIALHVGLRQPERLAGIAALSTYLVLPETLADEASEAQHGLPVFVGHGSHDPVVIPARGRAARDWLTQHEYAVEYHEYPMDHSVCEPELAHLAAWLETVFGQV